MHAPDPNCRKVVKHGFREADFLTELGIPLSISALVGANPPCVSNRVIYATPALTMPVSD